MRNIGTSRPSRVMPHHATSSPRAGTGQRDDDAFGHEQTNQAGALGTERQTKRHLSRAVHATGQHHAADVGAGDEQHKTSQRRDECDESGDGRAPVNGQRGGRLDTEPMPTVVIGVFAREFAGDARHLGLACASLTPSLKRPIPISHC